jgi:outer membrane receptor for ferrienterochelin and colicins
LLFAIIFNKLISGTLMRMSKEKVARPVVSLAATAIALAYQIHPQAIAQEIPAGANPDSQSAYNNKMYRVEVKGRPQSDIDMRRRSSVAKQIYGNEEIEKYGDTNMSEVLRRLPGVEVQGGAPRLRGLGAGYSQLLINGEPAPSGFSLDHLSPGQVERVEISKAATADQSGQAIGGTLNIILKSPPRKQQASLRVGASYSDARPTPNMSMTYGSRAGGVSYSLPISAFEWRGETLLGVNRRLPDANGVIEHSLQDAKLPQWGYSISTSPQLNWKINDDENFNLQAFLQRNYWNSTVLFKNIEATTETLLEDPSRNKGSFKNERIGAQWRRRLSDTQDLELKLSVGNASDDFLNRTFKSEVPYRISTGSSSDRTVLQSGKFVQSLADKHSFSVGWEIENRRRVDDRNVQIFGNDQLPGIDGTPFSAQISRRAVYLQDELAVSDQLVVYGGVRNESIRVRSDSTVEPVDNTSRVLTPLLHLTYKPSAKGRDLVRTSITRSYKAPDIYALIARPALNSLYPLPNEANNEIATDKAGNPNLRPELATGIDVAYEMYTNGGSIVSIGLFHRNVKDLVRYVNTLEHVSWASVERWVSRPQNFSSATSSGLEIEFKGRAADLLPIIFDKKSGLNVRGAFNLYRSHVRAVPLPNSRLDNQQPWSATMGFDYKLDKLPMSFGGNMAYTPGYITQQTLNQLLDQSRSRALDLYAQYTLSKDTTLRFAITNAAPVAARRSTVTDSGALLETVRDTRTNYSVTLDFKFQ